jgi:DinB superfamily
MADKLQFRKDQAIKSLNFLTRSIPSARINSTFVTPAASKPQVALKENYMSHETQLRKQLVQLITGEDAHAGFEKAIKGLPVKDRGRVPKGAEHSAWQLLEHLRIAQWDILEFSRDPKHNSPKWPDAYWPKDPEPPSDIAWEQSVKTFRQDQTAMCGLISDPDTDLYAKIPGGDGQTILREALLIADHNAYHVGQLVLLRRLLGDWK